MFAFTFMLLWTQGEESALEVIVLVIVQITMLLLLFLPSTYCQAFVTCHQNDAQCNDSDTWQMLYYVSYTLSGMLLSQKVGSFLC